MRALEDSTGAATTATVGSNAATAATKGSNVAETETAATTAMDSNAMETAATATLAASAAETAISTKVSNATECSAAETTATSNNVEAAIDPSDPAQTAANAASTTEGSNAAGTEAAGTPGTTAATIPEGSATEAATGAAATATEGSNTVEAATKGSDAADTETAGTAATTAGDTNTMETAALAASAAETAIGAKVSNATECSAAETTATSNTVDAAMDPSAAAQTAAPAASTTEGSSAAGTEPADTPVTTKGTNAGTASTTTKGSATETTTSTKIHNAGTEATTTTKGSATVTATKASDPAEPPAAATTLRESNTVEPATNRTDAAQATAPAASTTEGCTSVKVDAHPPQPRQPSATNHVFFPAIISPLQRTTDFVPHVHPFEFHRPKDSRALRFFVICFDNLSCGSYSNNSSKVDDMKKATYEALRMQEDLKSDVGLLTEIGEELIKFLRDLIDDFFEGRYECHAVRLGKQGRHWNVLIIRRASFSSGCTGEIRVSFVSSYARFGTQEIKYPQCILESPLFPGKTLAVLGAHAVPCNPDDIHTCIDVTLPAFANSNPGNLLIGFGDWNFKVRKVDSCHVPASIALNLNVVGNKSNNAGAYTSRGLATQWFLIPTPPNFDGMDEKCNHHPHHFVMDVSLASASSDFPSNNYHPLPAPAPNQPSSNNCHAPPAPAPAPNNCHAPPAPNPFADLLALNRLHYKTLQRYCRKGPDAPFDRLPLTREQWRECYSKGEGCKGRIVDSIASAVGPHN
ncbi:Hypothetical protein, putative [Bodo saltans]|uniref:Uncharacterized protein n=1 Tax=Bodo saltans TaxID=75058 RepID=A0A0S4IK23_BODSA|nr:Hypothetical protein, putative [Bodo saltans]|eukprot:CUE99828.1 Hypothetical protein, putative [Bodo saltans]